MDFGATSANLEGLSVILSSPNLDETADGLSWYDGLSSPSLEEGLKVSSPNLEEGAASDLKLSRQE